MVSYSAVMVAVALVLAVSRYGPARLKGSDVGGQGGPDGPQAAWFDAGGCLRAHLAEAIASIRTQTAVMLSLAPDHVSGAGATGPEGESTPARRPGDHS
jgi:hypothetical protein